MKFFGGGVAICPWRTSLPACRHLGAAHRGLWQTLGSSRAGEQSSQREYGPSRNDPDVQEEIKYIETAVLSVDMEVLAKYGGVSGIAKRLRYLKDLPKSSGPGATIDDYETWVSDRLRAQETV